jgi:hypothetical protein
VGSALQLWEHGTDAQPAACQPASQPLRQQQGRGCQPPECTHPQPPLLLAQRALPLLPVCSRQRCPGRCIRLQPLRVLDLRRDRGGWKERW